MGDIAGDAQESNRPGIHFSFQGHGDFDDAFGTAFSIQFPIDRLGRHPGVVNFFEHRKDLLGVVLIHNFTGIQSHQFPARKTGDTAHGIIAIREMSVEIHLVITVFDIIDDRLAFFFNFAQRLFRHIQGLIRFSRQFRLVGGSSFRGL